MFTWLLNMRLSSFMYYEDVSVHKPTKKVYLFTRFIIKDDEACIEVTRSALRMEGLIMRH